MQRKYFIIPLFSILFVFIICIIVIIYFIIKGNSVLGLNAIKDKISHFFINHNNLELKKFKIITPKNPTSTIDITIHSNFEIIYKPSQEDPDINYILMENYNFKINISCKRIGLSNFNFLLGYKIIDIKNLTENHSRTPIQESPNLNDLSDIQIFNSLNYIFSTSTTDYFSIIKK